ncbi:MAG TPA: lamin tail domain-containing protein [Cyclobacteriaceae bacterium]|nr:lamin tail domain-containing protein [Cyclobacteriaceae bacterium]
MTKFLWALAITIVSSTTLAFHPAFAQFSDDFSDGDFVSNPEWVGSPLRFVVASGRLQLQAPAEAAQSFLSVNSTAINNASWEFLSAMDFNPSGSNYTRIYLTSDQADLSGPLNGYYVLIGGTSDEMSLFRQTGLTHTKIIDGTDGRVNLPSVEVRIKVIRDANDNWELYSDVGLTGTYFQEGNVNDALHPSSQYFGIYCSYTSTRSDKFSFDDFVVVGDPFVDNSIRARKKDVILTEIFPDPSPNVELPEAEFLEIFNRSSNELNLNNWSISDGASISKLPNQTISPGEYLVIVPSSSQGLFSSYYNVMGVSNFPSLNNAGDRIVVKSAEGTTIDSVQYSSLWYKDSEKENGGWSLELIDPNNPCGEEENWIASEDESGGTPGRQNSVYANKPDITGPSLNSAVANSPTTILLQFDEKLAWEDVAVSSIFIEPSLTVSRVGFSDGSLRNLEVTLDESMQMSLLYKITVNAVRDCNLNLINANRNSQYFAVTEEADSMDIVINEILFNPQPTGVDFVELHNSSKKYINLNNWTTANREDHSIFNERILTDHDVLLKPDSYLVLTSNPDVVIGQYPNSQIDNFLKADLPSLPDNEGSIVLITDSGKIIDAVVYSDDLHSPLIKDEEGVSLERVSFMTPSNDPQNWKSASTTEHYATPGYLNSNARPENSVASNSINVDPEIFQPVYGHPNFTQIHYHFDQGGFVANAKIFDAQGRPVKTLANNDVLGTEGFYRWDGDRDDGGKGRIGYYFVWFEVFDLAGEVRTFRRRIVIAGQF